MCDSLPFKKYTQKDLNWDNDIDDVDEDDFTATIRLTNRTYTLRIEQMDRNWWWCCFYVNEEKIWDNNDNPAKTLKSAKLQVLRELNKYRFFNF